MPHRHIIYANVEIASVSYLLYRRCKGSGYYALMPSRTGFMNLVVPDTSLPPLSVSTIIPIKSILIKLHCFFLFIITHSAPPLAILALVAWEMRLWLDGSPERVAVLHCKGTPLSMLLHWHQNSCTRSTTFHLPGGSSYDYQIEL